MFLLWGDQSLGFGTGFRPTQLSNLEAWYDGADSNTITLNGSTVSSWGDKSGNGRNAAQATGAAQPTYTASAINGKSALSFDGGDNLAAVLSSDITTSNFTAFIVAKRNSTVAFAATLSGVAAGQANDFDNNGSAVIFDETADGSLLLLNNNGSKSSAPHPGNGVVYQAATLFDGVNNTTYLNGVAQTPVADTNTLSFHTLYLGARFVGSAVTAQYNGLIAEIILYNRALSAAERSQVFTYLANKWGIS